WKVHQDPAGLNRTTTFEYTTFAGESGLLCTITDAAGRHIDYVYALPVEYGTSVYPHHIWEPGAVGNRHEWLIDYTIGASAAAGWVQPNMGPDPGVYAKVVDCGCDAAFRTTWVSFGTATGPSALYSYDLDNNVIWKQQNRLHQPNGLPVWL